MIRTVDNFLETGKSTTLVLVLKTLPKFAFLVKIQPDSITQVSYTKSAILSDLDIVKGPLAKETIHQLKELNNIPMPLIRLLLIFDARFTSWIEGNAVWGSLLIESSEYTSFELES
jgi:hypothetical protein